MSTQIFVETVHKEPELVRTISVTSLSLTYNTGSTTTGSTEWGPGTIMGRVLLGFGEAVKDGIDNIIIRRKLHTANAVFIHDKFSKLSSKDAGQLYDDVLELSRPGLYRDHIRHQAWGVLLAQIALRQTQFLLLSLDRWPILEVQLFLSQLISCMPWEWSQERDSSHPIYGPLTDVYVSSQNQEKHPAFPFFDFIVQLCQRSPAGCQAVLDADILDLLVCMNVHDFSIPILHPDKDDADGCRSMVLDVCHSLLMHLSGHADIFRIVLNHPICALWPKHHLFHKDLATSDEVRWKRRRLAWGQVQESLVSERLNRIPDFYYASPGDIWEMADLGDACVDLLEFMSWSDPVLSSLAQSHLLQCFVIGGRHCEVLADVLSNSSYEQNISAFSRIIQYLLSLRNALPPILNSTTRSLSESSFTGRFLLFCILAINRSDILRRALMDAGVLHLILSVTDDLIPHRPMLSLESQLADVIPLLLINRQALADLVQTDQTPLSDDTDENLHRWRKRLYRVVTVLLGVEDVAVATPRESEPICQSGSPGNNLSETSDLQKFVCQSGTSDSSLITTTMAVLVQISGVLWEYMITIQQRNPVSIDLASTIKSLSCAPVAHVVAYDFSVTLI